MPSSSELVATRQGSSPDLRRSSTTRRSSRASEPWWARAMYVVRRRPSTPLLRRQLVQPHGEPLRSAAAVHEDDRRAVLPDELEQLGIDRRPDRARRGGRLSEPGSRQVAAARRRAIPVHAGSAEVGCVGLGHAVDRHMDLQVERLAHAGVHDAALAPRPDEEPADLLERPLGGGQPDPLERARGLLLEPLERERQVSAALGAGHGVDLVDDHRVRVGQELARPRGEHQVERLGRRDQHVRRRPEHRLTLLLGRVARADGDADVAADALQRRAQVLLDVVGEGLQRRDVDEAARCRGSATRRSRRPEKGRERLPGAGRG